MTCQEIQNLLPGYWENLLSPEERSLIESHLSFCDLCRRSLIDLKDSENLLKHLEEVEPPPFFEQRIMSRIREEAGRKKGLLRKFFFPIYIKIPLQVMATLLIAVLAAYLYQKNEPEMKPMLSFSVPYSEIQKSPMEAESLKSAQPPAGAKEPESLQSNKPSITATPSSPDPDGALHKKDQPRFAAAPPAAAREKAGESVELMRPKEEEKAAAEKAGTSLGGLRDKEDSVHRQALHKPRVEEQEPIQSFDAEEKEGKKKLEMAEKGAGEKSPLLRSAPTPLGSVSAKTENRTVINLNLQVRDTSQAVRQIEERLTQAGARILERTQGEGRALLKAEMAYPKFASFLNQLEEIGRVVFNKETLSVPVDRVTVLIHIFK
ncbi:MAG: DUF2275 domain-containing protein [Syntrophales bacterium LBB04]|nr:DUF2275 domain-containing protein [Syntrophales bacterium LBB04]